MAPVVRELTKYPDRIKSAVCVTAQHREMLDQTLDLFGIVPDIDLDLMQPEQALPDLTARVVTAVSDVLFRVKPNLVLIQGDTTTVMATALAAFYQHIPVGHVEAGLRTHNRYAPFPEEINRRLTSVLATYHFAPTQSAVNSLLAEGVPKERIYLTGNPVIDALLWVMKLPPSARTRAVLCSLGLNKKREEDSSGLEYTASGPLNPLILVTAHRRENFGQPLESICRALRALVERNSEMQVVYPVHFNPQVRETAYRIICNHPRIHLLDPLPYETFAHLMKVSYLILTDSGGIQEEAPALGKPVLVLREVTERPEAVEAGTVKVIGTDSNRIVSEVERLVYDEEGYRRMVSSVSPYGDGHAAEQIVQTIVQTKGS
jgi:UDP-N-acetylglucosamine 2-epimerase (non-hydrolysing)